MDPQNTDLLIDFDSTDDKAANNMPVRDTRCSKTSTCSSDDDFLDFLGTSTTGNTDAPQSAPRDDFFMMDPFVNETTSQSGSQSGFTDLDLFDPFSSNMSKSGSDQQVMSFDLLDGFDFKPCLSVADSSDTNTKLLDEGLVTTTLADFTAGETDLGYKDRVFDQCEHDTETVTLNTMAGDGGEKQQNLDFEIKPVHIKHEDRQPDSKDFNVDLALTDCTSEISCIREGTQGKRANEEGQLGRISEITPKSAVDNQVKMSQRTRGNLNRSMEKSFEDLLTGLESDGEPDIDDIINNCDLPEHVTDATFNALASENKKSYEQSVAQKSTKQSEDTDDYQLPRQSTTYTDEDDSFHGKPLRNGDNFDVSGVERVSFFSDEEEEEEGNEEEVSKEEEVNDDPGVHSPLAGEEESFRFDRHMSDQVEEEEEEEEEVDDKENEVQSEEGADEPEFPSGVIRMSREDTNLTSTSMTFQGIDQDDSDPDIDRLVEDCAYLPETVTDSTINFMVQSNKPLAKSYRESQEREEEEINETMGENEAFGQDTEQNEQEEELPRDPSMDFSVIEQDASHLDVDIGRQKMDLRKKGSLAKRRKPTRTNVRSALLSGEDTTFQDSTGLDDKTANKEERTSLTEEEEDIVPTSPPAKKPSPTAIALPSLTSKAPPVQRKSFHSGEEDMSVDSTPKRNYRNIGVKLPVPERKPSRKESTDGDDVFEQDFTFEKPTLKKVDRAPPTEVKSTDSDKRFDVPALKSVTRENKSRKSSETESDKFFSKPALKQVTKTEGQMSRTSPETDAKFEVPSLKSVPKRHSETSSESEKRFDKPSLRAVDRIESGKTDDSDKTFVKPALKNAPKPYLDKPITPKSPEAKTFEIPNLRKTPKVDRGNIDSSERLGLFDKPSLRNVSKPVTEEKDKSIVDQEGDTRYTFEKPTLRTVPRDNLPTQTLRAGKQSIESKTSVEMEEKHRFDIPTLRNVSRDSRQSEASQNTRGESEPLSQLRTQLRATPRKDVPKQSEGGKGETPSWLKDMKLKRTKSQSEDINDIENQNKNNADKPPSWGDRERLRKTSNSLPLQESADNLISNAEETSRRKRSTSSELEKNGDILNHHERKAFGSRDTSRDQYVPSWMKSKDSTKKSNPNLNFVSPPNGETSELPQWKRDLAERRKTRKDSDTPMKAVGQEKSEPSWKQEMKLKPATPSHSSSSAKKPEPEWKQKAEEKRQRIIKSGLFDRTLRKTE